MAGQPLNVRGTDYGKVLVGPGGLVVYMYVPDRRSKSTCYGKCARYWHPLLTKGRPRAGAGVKANLLGTTTRKDGRVQVTYNGHPLYFDNESGESQRRRRDRLPALQRQRRDLADHEAERAAEQVEG